MGSPDDARFQGTLRSTEAAALAWRLLTLCLMYVAAACMLTMMIITSLLLRRNERLQVIAEVPVGFESVEGVHAARA